MSSPELLGETDGDRYVLGCPGRAIVGLIEEEQVRGPVSIEGPKCEHHETRDLTDQTETLDG